MYLHRQLKWWWFIILWPDRYALHKVCYRKLLMTCVPSLIWYDFSILHRYVFIKKWIWIQNIESAIFIFYDFVIMNNFKKSIILFFQFLSKSIDRYSPVKLFLIFFNFLLFEFLMSIFGRTDCEGLIFWFLMYIKIEFQNLKLKIAIGMVAI